MSFNVSRSIRTAVLSLGMALFALAPAAQAQAQADAAAGQVTHLQGMATAQKPDGGFRFLGQGDPVMAGDTLSTTDRGYAVITLQDGTKFTLRPSTTFTLEQFQHGRGEESAWMRLVKGGARIVTGLTGRRNPAGVQLRTSTATVGIRGTSFDARLCGEDCRQENIAQAAAGNSVRTAVTQPVAARVVQVTGEAVALNTARVARPLAVGGSLFEGEDVRTGSGTVVLGFRDQSKVSVNPNTVMRISSFSFGQPQKPDNMALGLLKGGIRTVTGSIGKASPDSTKVRTLTSTLGVRGTGMDISCEGPCVDPELGPQPPPPGAPGPNPQQGEGLFLLTWEGLAYFERGPLDIPLNRAGFIGADGMPRVLISIPEFFAQFAAPRPDGVPVDWNQLFAASESTGEDGLYVTVRDGHVRITSGDSFVDLGPGEAGFSGRTGDARRIHPVPLFLRFDPFPLPENFSQGDRPLLQLFGVTLGQPGQEICRL